MVCAALMVPLGLLVTMATADSPISLSRGLSDTSVAVSCPPSSLRMISPGTIVRTSTGGHRVDMEAVRTTGAIN